MELFRSWNSARRFLNLPRARRRLAFYAEDVASWEYLGPIVHALRAELDIPLCYLTSDQFDPRLSQVADGFEVFYVGSKGARTYLFTAMNADVVVMTMPDLQTYHLKRSRAHGVHYVYVFHSIVSTHMVYRPAAFDNYDTILCVGEHHIEEIRATETLLGLQAKQLVRHGYGRLDAIIAERGVKSSPRVHSEPIRVLVAPSWGATCLLETRGAELTRLLLQEGFEVVVRPHPMTVRKSPRVIEELRSQFSRDARFSLDLDIASRVSLHRSDIMISDWSGAALDFAFGLERPVLFVDTERKVNNPQYSEIGLVPIEESIREQVGETIDPARLDDAATAIRRLCNSGDSLVERIRETRTRTVFNVGESGSVGARAIRQILQSQAGEHR